MEVRGVDENTGNGRIKAINLMANNANKGGTEHGRWGRRSPIERFKQMKLKDNRRCAGNEIAQVVGGDTYAIKDRYKGHRHRGWGRRRAGEQVIG